MAEKILNTRIQLKYDSYTNWTTNNPVLKKGEVAIATIDNNADGIKNAPSIVVKVGDGEHNYNSLKFISGLAADVYGWAKAENKPSYTASEIGGLSEYISGEIQDTDTQYKLVKVDDYHYKLQSKALDGVWADVADGTIVIPKYDDTEVRGLITAIKDGTSIDSFADVEAALSGKQATGDYALNSTVNDVSERVTAIEGDYLKAADKTEVANAAAAAKSAADAAQGDINAIKADYLKAADKTALEGKITTAQNAANDAQTDVDALAAIVGTVAEGKTVVQMIADAQTAATYDDTEVRGLIGDNADGISGLEGQVNTLVGSDTGKSVRTIANEELAAQLIPADAAESLNTLQEIANWIQDHPGNASAMNTAITALQNQLKGIAAGEGTVKKYVDDAITALKIGDYAKASDLTALAGRVTTLEGEMDTVQGAVETAQGNIANNATAISNLDESLAAIAKTGNVNDLIQTAGDVLVFDCGTSAI